MAKLTNRPVFPLGVTTQHVTKTVITDWDVIGHVETSVTASWDVLQKATQKVVTTSWNVKLKHISKVVTTSWDVLKNIPPQVEVHPVPRAVPPTVNTWCYYLMRIPSREWLDRDVDLSDVAIQLTLSGPCGMTASIDHEYAKLKGPDGKLIVDPYSTMIIAEKDGTPRVACIVTNADPTGDSVALTCTGFSSLYKSMPLEKTLAYGGNNSTGKDASGPVSGTGADTIQVTKDMITQIEDLHPNANLKLTFSGSSASGFHYASWHNVPNSYDYTPSAATEVTITTPDNVSTPTNATLVQVDVQGVSFTKKRKSGVTKVAPNPTKSPIYWDWHVYNYDVTDISAQIDTYAQSTPFDYMETVAWADADKTDVKLGIQFGSPRLGKTSDLVFIEGDNVSGIVPVTNGGDTYSNAVLAIGAGDGAAQLRCLVSVDDGRVRKCTTVTDTTITNANVLKAYANSTLASLTGIDSVQSFILDNHPNAPFGGFNVGDDITLEFTVGWMAGQTIKLRIIEIDFDPAGGRMTIATQRADSFRYSPSVSV